MNPLDHARRGDLLRVRASLERLDLLAREHPDAFARDDDGWRDVIAREDEDMAVSKVVALRLPDDVLARVDAHAARLTKLTGLEPSRSEVIKLLVERGLASVEAGEPAVSKTKARKK